MIRNRNPRPAQKGDDRLRSQVIDGNKARSLVNALCKDGLVNVRCRPAVMTLSGEAAEIAVGDCGPIPVQKATTPTWEKTLVAASNQPCGLRFSVTPEVLKDQTIRLALDLRRSQRVDQMPTAGDRAVQPIRSRRLRFVRTCKCGMAKRSCSRAEIAGVADRSFAAEFSR